MIADADVEHALKILHDTSAAKKRAAAEWAKDTLKIELARIASHSNEKSQAARESWALQQADYAAALGRLKDATEADYEARQRLSAAGAVIDCWRTESASNRNAGKLG